MVLPSAMGSLGEVRAKTRVFGEFSAEGRVVGFTRGSTAGVAVVAARERGAKSFGANTSLRGHHQRLSVQATLRQAPIEVLLASHESLSLSLSLSLAYRASPSRHLLLRQGEKLCLLLVCLGLNPPTPDQPRMYALPRFDLRRSRAPVIDPTYLTQNAREDNLHRARRRRGW